MMPEGDTIFRAARTLHRALAGQVVTRFETQYAQIARVHDDAPITGRIVEKVESRGQAPAHVLLGDRGPGYRVGGATQPGPMREIGSSGVGEHVQRPRARDGATSKARWCCGRTC